MRLIPAPSIRSLIVVAAGLLTQAPAALAAELNSTNGPASSVNYTFDTGGQTLTQALKTYAQTTNQQIIFTEDLVAGRQAPALKGEYTAEAALTYLLNGTGLTAERSPSGALMIKRPGKSTTRQSGTVQFASPALRLAQSEAGDAPVSPMPAGLVARADENTQAGAGTAENRSHEDSNEVLVTGSHIRGARNDTSPVAVFDHDYIERSGYSNMMQFAQSLPMNFSGGASGSSEVSAFGLAPMSGQNLTRGTGFNLRGLSSVSTLTLINGRRVAPSAEGVFVDISTIPLAAVDRVEILTDGASAVYGADAIAGVVNIILRKDFSGAQTDVQFGTAGVGEGGSNEMGVSQTVGTAWSSGSAMAVAQYYKRDPLDARDRDYIVAAGGAIPGGPTYLLPKRMQGSLIFNLRQQLPGNFELLADAQYAYEEVNQASTDIFEDLSTNDPRTNKWNLSVGLGRPIFADWRMELDANVSRVETDTDFTSHYLPDGSIDFLINDYRDRFGTWSTDLKADGSIFTLPSGKVRFATGGSYREDKLFSARVWRIPARGYQLHADDERTVKSFFGELFVPLVARAQGLPWAKRIDLSVAARRDDYSDFGGTTNPKFGLVWSPVESLDIRATYSTSFRAPSVAEKRQQSVPQISTTTVQAADGSGTPVPIFYLAGSRPLGPEKAKNMAVGFTIRPAFAQGLDISVNYYRIDYTGRISTPPFDQDMLTRRSDYGTTITDLADDAAAQAYLDAYVASGALYIDFLGTGATGVRYVFDWQQKNAARTRTNGFDLAANYAFTRASDTFNFNLSLTHINSILDSLTSESSTIEDVNVYEQPLAWRARGLGTWTRGGLNTTVALNYAGSYLNRSVSPHEPISAWTTADLNLSYTFAGGAQWPLWQDAKIGLNVSNLFNTDPPRATDFYYSMGFDVFNANAMGRYLSVNFSKRW